MDELRRRAVLIIENNDAYFNYKFSARILLMRCFKNNKWV